LEPELETMKKKKKRRKEEDVSRRAHQFTIPFSRSSRTVRVRAIERKERKE